MQFPVSSGQQHRKTENEWVPVPPKKPDPPPLPTVKQITNPVIPVPAAPAITEIVLPPQEEPQQPAIVPVIAPPPQQGVAVFPAAIPNEVS